MVIINGKRTVLTNKLTYDNIYKDKGFVVKSESEPEETKED